MSNGAMIGKTDEGFSLRAQ